MHAGWKRWVQGSRRTSVPCVKSSVQMAQLSTASPSSASGTDAFALQQRDRAHVLRPRYHCRGARRARSLGRLVGFTARSKLALRSLGPLVRLEAFLRPWLPVGGGVPLPYLTTGIASSTSLRALDRPAAPMALAWALSLIGSGERDRLATHMLASMRMDSVMDRTMDVAGGPLLRLGFVDSDTAGISGATIVQTLE